MESQVSVFKVPEDGGVLKTADVVSLVLAEKVKVSHNVYIFKFKLPEGLTLGVPLGSHVRLIQEIDGEVVRRPFSPISDVL